MLRQLYALQELDSEISQCHSAISSIDGQLGERAELEALSRQLETQRERFNKLRLQQRSQDLDAESVRAKVQDVEGKLYGGRITNLREMDGYQKETTLLRSRLQKLDDKLLETMVTLEEAQERVQTLEDVYGKDEERWQARQRELAEERKRLEQTLNALEARRREFVSRVGQRELKLYEDLRTSKGGLAISRVERGMCRACRMGLPTTQLQRARMGREPVFCGSCGRILLVI